MQLSEDFGRFSTVESLSDQFIGAAGPGGKASIIETVSAIGEHAREEEKEDEAVEDLLVVSDAAVESDMGAAIQGSFVRDEASIPVMETDPLSADHLKEDGNAALKQANTLSRDET